MEKQLLEKFYGLSDQRLMDTPVAFRRYLHAKMDWSPRLLYLRGSRGVGKTTMMLQHMKDMGLDASQSLYLSLDNIWLAATELHDLVRQYVQMGGTHLFLDEVHFIENWQTLVKNINDDFRSLQIVFTGSSLLRIEKSAGDLSRRLAICDLHVMSFREFLAFEGLGEFAPFGLEELLKSHVAVAREIVGKVKAILRHFGRYLEFGCYPFYKEAGSYFSSMLRQAMNQVLDSDYPKIEEVEPSTIRKARRMLRVLADSAPQTPNVTALCRELEMDRKSGVKMLYALDRAGLLQLLSSDKENLKNLSTPDKILCGDPNIMHVLSLNPDMSSLRETFFLNQLGAVSEVTYPVCGDFLVDGKWLFEVGGKGKKFGQIKDLPDSFVAADDIETGFGNKIPLWLFGFLY